MTATNSPCRCELYPTIITPFFEDHSIDYEGLRRMIAHFASTGCDGIFAVCQSSEMFYLDDREKLEVAAFSLDCCRALGLRCVVSGHTQDALDDQIAYLRALEKLGPDAIILVSNRLASASEPDETLIRRLEEVTSALDPRTRLGMYECPHPYKRLLTSAVIDAMIRDGRFGFLKDTCCEKAVIARRLAQIEGSSIALYNANSATLYDSLVAGAAGYSGILLNFVPELFALLKKHLTADPPHRAVALAIADYLSAASIVECQNYPGNAKHYLREKGLIAGVATRAEKPPLTGAQRMEIQSILRQNEAAWYRFGPRASTETLFEAGRFFKSCHASSVLPLADGTVLCAYFAGDHEKADNVGIWLSRKVAGCWQPPAQIAKASHTAHWNPVLMETAQGIRLVFKVGRTIPAWESYTMTSTDGGVGWSRPVPYRAACGPVRSKPIVLANGLMLAPNSTETESAWRAHVDVSNDGGASFTRLADIPLNTSRPGEPNHIEGLGAIQPTLWESAPGRVHALLRTTCGFIFRSDSTDSGKTWCEAYNTNLPNNNSGIDIAHAGNTLYLAMNPVGQNWGLRTPLVILSSKDNGAHFARHTTLQDAQLDDDGARMAEFSYPAIVAREGSLHITFTDMRRRIAYARLDLAKGEPGL